MGPATLLLHFVLNRVLIKLGFNSQVCSPVPATRKRRLALPPKAAPRSLAEEQRSAVRGSQ